jgi:hypothetical protein
MHAIKMHAQKVHTHKVHAQKTYAHEIHAHETHAREMHVDADEERCMTPELLVVSFGDIMNHGCPMFVWGLHPADVGPEPASSPSHREFGGREYGLL